MRLVITTAFAVLTAFPAAGASVPCAATSGERLEHDFVVRDLAGPFPAGTFTHAFAVDAQWKLADLGVAAFVHDARSGNALQALTLAVCRG